MDARLDGLTVPTPWYPTPFNRMSGSFVAEYARLVGRVARDVHVVHAQEWPGGKAGADAERLRPGFDDGLDRLAAGGGLRVTGAAGAVSRVPVFTVGGTTVPQRAEAMVRDVRRALGGFDTPVVHGHVGYWGGLLAARLADPESAVFATEHSTGLREVLADPAGRDHYAELLTRATKVFCVSGLLRDQIVDVLPEHAERVEVLHNPVDFHGVPHRGTPVESLDRWVFVGGLVERKGVERLVRAFCVVARERPTVSLTLFGDGPLRDTLAGLAAEAGVADRLHLLGVVPHAEVLTRLPEFDLLLAPSTYETFHLAVVEGVAAGLAVVVTRSGGPEEALAGVESRVGRFVDVADSPDAIVEAYRELSGDLGSLDPEGVRKELDARYGPDAVTARLAAAYRVEPGAVLPTVPAAVTGSEPVRAPERIVLVAASAWRRYGVEAELAAARRSAAPTVVVTGDPQVTAWAQGLRVVGPGAVSAVAARTGTSAGPATTAPPAGSLPVRARRAAGLLKRRLQGRPATLPKASAALAPADLDHATIVVTDCHSMPLAARLADVATDARLVVELDRRGRLGPPPDGADEVPG
jgi:glycosyltransferase involved in cell wall biosynthesis